MTLHHATSWGTKTFNQWHVSGTPLNEAVRSAVLECRSGVSRWSPQPPRPMVDIDWSDLVPEAATYVQRCAASIGIKENEPCMLLGDPGHEPGHAYDADEVVVVAQLPEFAGTFPACMTTLAGDVPCLWVDPERITDPVRYPIHPDITEINRLTAAAEKRNSP